MAKGAYLCRVQPACTHSSNASAQVQYHFMAAASDNLHLPAQAQQEGAGWM